MNSPMFAGLLAVLALAAAPAAALADEAAPASAQLAPPATSARATVRIDADAPKADPRFSAYCLRDTGSVIVAMQNRRAERIAKANGTTPKLRCTGMGVALRVNADGVPVPDQGQPASRMR